MNTQLETERRIACSELARFFAHMNCGNHSKALAAKQELSRTLARAEQIFDRRFG